MTRERVEPALRRPSRRATPPLNSTFPSHGVVGSAYFQYTVTIRFVSICRHVSIRFEGLIRLENDTEYGLQASVWTQNLRVAHTMARKIKAGTICINTHNYGDPAWPFGGYKQSGWGREMGKEVLEHYTETKSVAARL